MSAADSIMYYTNGTDWDTFDGSSFTPVFSDDSDSWNWETEALRGNATEICGDDSACLYDIYITGDISVGESSKATAEESVETNNALGMIAYASNRSRTY